MKSRFDVLDLVKAQVSNKSAERCKDMKTVLMILIIIGIIFITAFPYVNQRVGAGLRNSDASKYPGLGSALISAAKNSSGFHVENDELVCEVPEQRFTDDRWVIVFTQDDAEKVLGKNNDLQLSSSIIFGKTTLLINCPENKMVLNGSYKTFPDFSSEQILKASKNTDTMVLYIQAMLFTLSNAQVPAAILMMILLISLQTVLFIFAMAFLLSYSKRNGWDKQGAYKKYGFVSSAKIMTSVAILPALIVSGFSYYNPSFGLSLGWIIYSFILGLRAITIYFSRVRGRDTRPVV